MPANPVVARSHFANDSGAAPPATPYRKLYAYDANNNMIYEAWAPPGSATSDAVWAIKKYTYSNNGGVWNLIGEQWANGRSLFENAYDNVLVLTYS